MFKKTKIYAASNNPYLKSCVSPEVLNRRIRYCVPVRRPLDVPGTITKLGKVLSHSGVICTTECEDVLVEYMSSNQVFVTLVTKYSPDRDDFQLKNYHFKCDTMERQQPNKPVTVREFATSMINFMKGLPFNTFTHNCHHARYLTMAKYGMHSEDPDEGKTNLFFQGFIDYFNPDENE